jgi:hypothetical protein
VNWKRFFLDGSAHSIDLNCEGSVHQQFSGFAIYMNCHIIMDSNSMATATKLLVFGGNACQPFFQQRFLPS